jgi:hypothetical protein
VWELKWSSRLRVQGVPWHVALSPMYTYTARQNKNKNLKMETFLVAPQGAKWVFASAIERNIFGKKIKL